MADTAEETAAPAKPERTPEEWTYIGVRMSGDHETVFAWLDASGAELIYSKLKGAMVGGLHTVIVEREPGNVRAVPDPKWTGTHPDAAKRSSWMAEHRANEIAIDAWKLGKKETSEALERMTLRELGLKYRRLPVTRRRALLAVIIERVTGGRDA